MTTHKATSFIDRCIKDVGGKVVLWQAPNLPLVFWFVARVLSWPLHGTPQNAAKVIAYGALFTWAWLELFKGANYFRRVLGLVVLTMLVVSAAHSGRF